MTTELDARWVAATRAKGIAADIRSALLGKRTGTTTEVLAATISDVFQLAGAVADLSQAVLDSIETVAPDLDDETCIWPTCPTKVDGVPCCSKYWEARDE